MHKSGYTLRIYRILENDLVNFLDNISIEYYLGEERKKIYSPKLAELLIRIGSQVDIYFRNWDIVHETFKENNPEKQFNLEKLYIEYYRDIERDGKIILSDKKIKILFTGEILKPFEFWTDKRYPLWWKAYNNVKHQGFAYRKEGNLYNVIESLGALFLLNCVNEYAESNAIKYGFIDKGKGEFSELYITSHLFDYSLLRSQNIESI